MRLSTDIAPLSQDSSWTAGPQRLKPHYQTQLNRHEWNSCPSQFVVPTHFRYCEAVFSRTLRRFFSGQASSGRFIVIRLLWSYYGRRHDSPAADDRPFSPKPSTAETNREGHEFHSYRFRLHIRIGFQPLRFAFETGRLVSVRRNVNPRIGNGTSSIAAEYQPVDICRRVSIIPLSRIRAFPDSFPFGISVPSESPCPKGAPHA